MRAGRFSDPNLARSPFRNDRPAARLALTLWVLAVAVGGAALWTITSARGEEQARRAELDATIAETVARKARAAELRAELEAADLAETNDRTQFLNARIAERAFSWNDLFDALNEVLPRGVRIVALAPEGFGGDVVPNRLAQASPATSRVRVRITGEAEDSDAVLELVDRLFDHPAFGDPDLARESTKKDLRSEFDLTVRYRPEWRRADVETASPQRAEAATATAAPSGPGAAPAVASAVEAGPGRPAASPTPVVGGAGPTAPPARAAVAEAEAFRRPPVGSGVERREVRSAWGEASADEPEARGEERPTIPRRGGAPGEPLPGGSARPASGLPTLPTSLKPFASGPEPVRR